MVPHDSSARRGLERRLLAAAFGLGVSGCREGGSQQVETAATGTDVATGSDGTSTSSSSEAGATSSESGAAESEAMPDCATNDGGTRVLCLGPFEGLSVGMRPTGLAIADLDMDRAVDLVVADAEGADLLLLFGDGAGGFEPPVTQPVLEPAVAAAIGDFNGDAVADVAVARETGLDLLFLMGNAGRTYTPVTVPGMFQANVAVGRVDGDATEDAVFGQLSVVRLVLGSETGSLSDPITIAAPNRAVALADLDGDGAVDLLTVATPANVGVALGNGLGGVAEIEWFATGDFPADLTIADMDGDGDMDVVTAEQGLSAIGVLLGDGTGSLGEVELYELAEGTEPYAVAVGDLDGDGRTDVVTAGYYDSTLNVFLGESGGVLTAPLTFPAPRQVRDVAVHDIDGDGDFDVVLAGNDDEGGVVALYRGGA